MISLSSETILSIDALDELLWQLPRQEDDSGWKMLAEMRGLLDAYVTAEKLPYEEGEAKYTQNLGMRYFRHGDYEEALAAFEEAVEMWLDLGDELEQAKLIGYIGSCFWYLGYYGKALDMYRGQLEMGERLESEEMVAYAHTGLGVVYSRLGNFEEACYQNEFAVKYARKSEDFSRLVNALVNQVYQLVKLNRLEEAGELACEAIELAEKYVKRMIGEARSACFTVAFEMEDFAKAEGIARLNLSEIGKIGNESQRMSLVNLGRVLIKTNRPHEALDYLNQVQEFLNNSPHRPTLFRMLEAYISAYEELDDWSQVAYFQKKLFQETKTDYEIRTNRQVRYLETSFRTKFAKKEARIARDASRELSKKNQQLKKVLKEKNDLFHLVTHDLKNPLTSIQLVVQLIKRAQKKNPDSPLPLRYVESVEKSVSDMIRQVDSLHQSQQIEAHGIQPDLSKTEIEPIIEAVIQSYGLRVNEKNIMLLRDIEDDYAEIIVDPHLFYQVLDNLVSNAIKYSPVGSTVLIKTDCIDGWHQISVSDQGVGILPEEMPHLFKKFKQLSGRPTGGEHSTGLGLYVSKLAVELMGGEISAQSDGRNEGSTFTVKFPELK